VRYVWIIVPIFWMRRLRLTEIKQAMIQTLVSSLPPVHLLVLKVPYLGQPTCLGLGNSKREQQGGHRHQSTLHSWVTRTAGSSADWASSEQPRSCCLTHPMTRMEGDSCPAHSCQRLGCSWKNSE
jgi:hypothetical protein